jgi:hypothetical protein
VNRLRILNPDRISGETICFQPPGKRPVLTARPMRPSR